MRTGLKSRQELIQETEELASRAKSNLRLGESYVLESNAKLIESNARVEGEIGNLINELQKFNKESSAQTKELITLTRSIKDFNRESSAQAEKLVDLTQAIQQSNIEASGQADKLVKLTKWIVVLTFVLVAGLVVQLVTAK